MMCSLVLLVVLQAFWLAASWREAKDSFRREANILFRNVIVSMQDSLIARNIKPLGIDDTLFHRRIVIDSPPGHRFYADTAVNVGFRNGPAFVEVLIADAGDSAHRFLPALARRIRMEKGNRKFLVHLGRDSLNTDSVALFFRDALSASGLDVPFEVHRIPHMRKGGRHLAFAPRDGVVSDIIPGNPLNHYAVSFPSVDMLLLKEIAPEALFALFVTLVTGASFYVLNNSMRAQKKLVEMKNDLISNISHELKTPVATVSVALEALESFRGLDDPAKTQDYLRMAKNELSRLAFITDTVLQSALVENGHSFEENETFDFDHTVRSAIDSMRILGEKRGIGISYTKEGTDFLLTGKYPHLITVVYNILDNAIKYSPDKGSIVTVRLLADNSSITLSVADKGIGIPEAYRARVFDKFFRVPSGDVHNIKGYGLGLSYVATVVKEHQGSIRLDGNNGKGTCVTVTIPKVVL